ncbi:SpoIID/LytB domain-containing protein, partial [bacterium]|nr:SpoIID/LytB domain-containing protein [bacterium]
QCYQGVSREPKDIHPAIAETAGQILTHENKPADARYAKSCGGMSETYDAVWGGEGPAYLVSRACGELTIGNLKDEKAARDFLHQKPAAFCNDEFYPYPERWSEERHFRWRRDYSAKELENIIQNKTGVEVGTLRELRPLVRGASGRILILEIIGSKRTLKLYRELEIRRALSPSHLPSSCFIIEPQGKGPDRFIIIGGGWGHGVGLCQLGAVAMANQGWSAERILKHYYPNTKITEQS